MSAEQAMTWLVVEDEDSMREAIETMCELWGFDVYAFRDGHQAIRYLENQHLPEPLPDVALLDIRNPGPWGHEISALIRKHPLLHDIVIIIMTAYELPTSDETELLEISGADRVIKKPLPGMNQLLEMIQQVIAQRRGKGLT